MNKSKLTFYLLGKKYGFNPKKNLDFVMESQYWSREKIEEYQNEKLRETIEHAYKNVPYYQKQFKKLKLTPKDFHTKEDLQKLPVINKKIVHNNFDDFLAQGFQKYKPLERFSGGTTGVAFKFYNDLNSWALNWALKIRSFKWANYELGNDKLGVLAGGSLVPQNKISPQSMMWRYLQNYYTMPISHMTAEKLARYYKNLKDKKIIFLRGYPTAIYVLAKYLVEHNHKLPLVSVFTTAEMLHNHQRKMINKAFGCEPFDAYGCGEGMGSAFECEEHNGLHISFETSIFEILDKNGSEVKSGEEGEVTLTSLLDKAMPFIRYTPGDFAIKGEAKCSCGRNLALIEKIIGRTSDLIEFSNGIQLNGLSLPFEVWDTKIERFQIIQIDHDKVEVLFIIKDGFTEKDKERAHKVMQFHCGKDVDVRIKIVDDIPLPKSGKFRYVISKYKRGK